MKRKLMVIISLLTTFTILLSLFAVNVYAGQTFTNNATGTFEGYDYELWKDNGTTSMTLNGGGTFSCSWSNINNALFRTGKKLGSTKTYQDYGKIVIDYVCNYQPNGNSYMAVYGWTEDPLVEYYIIDSYGTWKPPGSGSTLKGTTTVDGRTYEIYQNSRTGPSIKGNNTTFQQYWSICTSKRTSGTITVSDHFKAWESKGMKMGKMYEVSMVVEGYQSSGKADMTKMNLTLGDTPSTSPSNPPSNTPTKIPSNPPSNTPIPSLEDINGDGAINIADVVLLATGFNASKNSERYNPRYDLDNNGAINIADVMMIASKFNTKVPVNPSYAIPTATKIPPSPTKNPNAKLVALTFDDGPSTQTTLVLDKLKKYNAKATFMLIGNKIGSADAVMKRIVSEGHECGNHSWSHLSMGNMQAPDIASEINQCNSAIQKYTGSAPKFFRAPNLDTSTTLFQNAKLPFVVGVIAQDWNGGSATTAQARADIVINGVKDGSIVLMHSDQPGNHPTPEALDIIIPNLQQKGYSFVTLSELFSLKGKTPQPGVSYDGAF